MIGEEHEYYFVLNKKKCKNGKVIKNEYVLYKNWPSEREWPDDYAKECIFYKSSKLENIAKSLSKEIKSESDFMREVVIFSRYKKERGNDHWHENARFGRKDETIELERSLDNEEYEKLALEVSRLMTRNLNKSKWNIKYVNKFKDKWKNYAFERALKKTTKEDLPYLLKLATLPCKEYTYIQTYSDPLGFTSGEEERTDWSCKINQDRREDIGEYLVKNHLKDLSDEEKEKLKEASKGWIWRKKELLKKLNE